MVPTTTLLELLILQHLEEVDSPSGAWAVHEGCRQRGMMVSPATIGRVLKSLDLQGFTRPVGQRGREITEAGRDRLVALTRDVNVRRLVDRLVNTAHHDVQALAELLWARRAVEGEAAYLAALAADESQIATLHKFASDPLDLTLDFHRTLCEFSGNRFLITMSQLLFKANEQLEELSRPALAEDKDFARFQEEHMAIWAAIRERRPERARRLMRQHMDTMEQELRRRLKVT